MLRTFLAAACVAILLLAARAETASAQTEVTTCGQVFSGDGFLPGDLDCSNGTTQTAITVNGGRLDLRGFTVTGSDGIIDLAIYCPLSCTIFSNPPGGTITGSPDPIEAIKRLRVEDVVLTGNSGGITARNARATLTNFTITGNVGGASAKSLIVTNSTLSANQGTNLSSQRKLKLRDTSVTGCIACEWALSAATALVLRDSDVSGNQGGGARLIGWRDRSRRIKVSGATVQDNRGVGLAADLAPRASLKTVVKLRKTTVSGNEMDGQRARDVRLGGSTVTGNGTALECGSSEPCADIASLELPRIDSASTCDTSRQSDSDIPTSTWGVCSLD